MAASLKLTKHHGLGNDFLVLLAEAQDDDVELPRPSEAVAWCDRHRGVGADGLIVARAGASAGSDGGADVVMELFNSDGSVAEISGNGIRCLCQAVLARRGRRSGSLVVDTAGGRRTLEAWEGPDAATMLVRVEMGPATVTPLGDLAVPAGVVDASAVSVGNPHVVFDVGTDDAVALFDIAGIGSELDAATPGGVNVHVVAATGPDSLVVRHWERGAGVTEACGSGATAAAVLMSRWGRVGRRVEVVMPGGSVVVDVGPGDGDPAHLEGPTVHVADIEIHPQPTVAGSGRPVIAGRAGV